MELVNKVDQATNLGGLLRLNLQFFAEGDPAPSDPPAGDPQPQDPPSGGEPPKPEGGEPKTFTQEDLNRIAAKEKKTARENLLKELGIEDFENAKDGMAKFKEWQESQKTDLEKQQEALQSLEKEKGTLATENQSLKAQLSALKQGVNGDSVEDVVALAERLVTDEVTIDDAIKQVIEKYPHFVEEKQEEEPKPSFTAGNHQRQSKGNGFGDILLGK